MLVTTLTKKMAEDLTDYLLESGVKARYLHSEIDTLERIQIIRELRLGEYDVLVGVNLLREGLDLPEVSLVAVLDADKEGFLRGRTSLIQTIGRAARNVNGKVLLYADKVTQAIQEAMDETNRRRAIQLAYNEEHGITPETIVKGVSDIAEFLSLESPTVPKSKRRRGRKDVEGMAPSELEKLIIELEEEMFAAAEELRFEYAAKLRDEIKDLRRELRRGRCAGACLTAPVLAPDRRPELRSVGQRREEVDSQMTVLLAASPASPESALHIALLPRAAPRRHPTKEPVFRPEHNRTMQLHALDAWVRDDAVLMDVDRVSANPAAQPPRAVARRCSRRSSASSRTAPSPACSCSHSRTSASTPGRVLTRECRPALVRSAAWRRGSRGDLRRVGRRADDHNLHPARNWVKRRRSCATSPAASVSPKESRASAPC